MHAVIPRGITTNKNPEKYSYMSTEESNDILKVTQKKAAEEYKKNKNDTSGKQVANGSSEPTAIINDY